MREQSLGNIIELVIALFTAAISIILCLDMILPTFNAIKAFIIACGIIMLIETIVVSVLFYRVLRDR